MRHRYHYDIGEKRGFLEEERERQGRVSPVKRYQRR